MNTKKLALVMSLVFLLFSLSGCAGNKQTSLLDPKHPTTVTVWNYYNGDQLTAFENLVSRFNATIGAEKGIVTVSVSQGSIDNLATSLLDSVNGKVGAANIPSVAAVYAETVYILNTLEAVAPLDDYFSDSELGEFVPKFLDEGRLTDNGALYLLPVSKSTECFAVNATDWAPFEAATGITINSISSYESLVSAAEAYYNWTDAQTPDISDDGKALYGRDSVANYIYVGAKQLGHELFSVKDDGGVTTDLDRDTFKALWDNYYIPYINGYFASYASYRSEDIKTGAILAMTGSTSGITYVPTAVTDQNDETHDITVYTGKSLCFAEAAQPVYVQQGAGYCVMKTTQAEQYAATEFLKWFTDVDQNLSFAVSSGYSPVKITANNTDKITGAITVDSVKKQNMLNALLISAEIFSSDSTYACHPFSGSKEVRNVISTAFEQVALADRAAVNAQIKQGVPRAEAVQPYTTEAYFDAWFVDFCAKIEAAIA